ncbi:MAG: 1-phosphofructokinase family hexose kinase [Defluviitaleaceae bacterium]|nr:1-phosphofructokinase family hexose kinase [Defluviitaleaceae bacterium]
MIYVASLNPCIDWQYSLPSLNRGGLNRVNFNRQDIGGKGINVAGCLKNLGFDPMLVGFNFWENGGLLIEEMDRREIRHNLTPAKGSIRVNIKLYENSGEMTELNQPGATVTAAEIKALQESIPGSQSDILVLSGSYPGGVDAGLYAQICQGYPGKTIIDAEGEALRLAISAKPFAIKPNLFELNSSFGLSLKTPAEIYKFCCQQLLSAGVSMVCVSMGASGAVLATSEGGWFSPALPVTVKGLPGAGDSMVAAMVYAIASGLPVAEFLPAIMGAAAASVSKPGTALCNLDEMRQLQENVLQFPIEAL